MSANLRPDLTDGTVLAYKTRATACDREVGFGTEGRRHESASFSSRNTAVMLCMDDCRGRNLCRHVTIAKTGGGPILRRKLMRMSNAIPAANSLFVVFGGGT